MIPINIVILFLIQFVFQCAQGDHFRKDYHYIEDTRSLYKIHTLATTLSKAQTACEREGANLFHSNDESEIVAVAAHWRKIQPTLHWVIVNMTKSNLITPEGKILTGVYSNWRKGEPNNADGNEDCIALNVDETMNDVNCNNVYPFICKKMSDSIKWDEDCNTPYPGYKFDAAQDKCYKFHSTPKNWTDAFAICYAEESSLAIIDNDAEAVHLVNLIHNSTKENVSKTESAKGIHLGFFNRDGWITIKGESLHESGYNKWAPSQPDGGISEDCGAMTFEGLLQDVSCSQIAGFVCEHKAY